jgi:hypothetical protein
MIEFNYLDKIKIPHQQIEKELKKQKLVFYSHKESYVENFNFDPHYFIYSFYDFLIKKNKIPSQKEFAEYYIKENFLFLKKSFLNHPKLKKDYLIKNLVYRLYRTFPSFIRDLHFSIYLKDKLLGRNIYYNPYIDVMNGIDILIDSKYAIHLYTDTKRARYYRNKKYNRHEKDEYIHLNIPIRFSHCYKCGDFFLYKNKEAEVLVKELNVIEKIRI